MSNQSISQIDRHLGELLVKLRVGAGMTQTEMGEACGVSFQQIQKYEAAVNRISVSRLDQMAHAMGIKPHVILWMLEPENER